MKHQAKDDQVKVKIKNKIDKDIEKQKRKKRSISSHITSRWYRAPEVILLEKQYDQAIDMRGIGCVIFELIKFQNRSQDKESSSSNKALYPRQYCFPLTPKGQMEDKTDQIQEILQLKDQLTELDTCFIQTSSGKKYVEKMQNKVENKPWLFQQELEGHDPRMIEMVNRLLEFNPYFRWTAHECLKSSYFDNIRNHHTERHPKKNNA